MAAIVNLNHPAHVITWHFISLSVANVIVIAVMLAVFALAIAIPFPYGEEIPLAQGAGGRNPDDQR
jgi:hypothetical protein